MATGFSSYNSFLSLPSGRRRHATSLLESLKMPSHEAALAQQAATGSWLWRSYPKRSRFIYDLISFSEKEEEKKEEQLSQEECNKLLKSPLRLLEKHWEI